MKVYIETYGCALNNADTALMKSILVSRGHEIVSSVDHAEVIIINTCTVRLDTEQRILKRLSQLKKSLNNNNVKLVVAGCMAAAQPYTVTKTVPEVSLISPQNVTRIHEVVESPGKTFMIGGERDTAFLCPLVEGFTAAIPIAEGCLGNCSFCITKIARRKLRSYKPDLVVRAVKEAVSKGAIEIDLTAQDTAAYGVDLGNIRLHNLVRTVVEEVRGNYMLRIGMANPDNLLPILDEFLEILKHPNIFKYVHIPLQSGSDKVLKLMKRRYTYDDYKSLTKEIRRKIPEVQLATDIIVGHPGEDEEDFELTIKALEELLPDKVHIAQYTIRPRTEAASMKQISDSIKKYRSTELGKVVEKIGSILNSAYVGTRAWVIVSRRSFRGTPIGRTINYKPVVISGLRELGVSGYVEITQHTFYDLRGRWSPK
ncbi:MAG: tRNA (N(6)-L-threonylcarbamoyladenosine(37)-C(2))-methylthiotransferase [Desulfurococcaceae archaeon TW002]